MTTLTERLREFQQTIADGYQTVRAPDLFDDATTLAQELHALLVECGEALKGDSDAFNGDYWYDIKRAKSLLTKLKQAGIV